MFIRLSVLIATFVLVACTPDNIPTSAISTNSQPNPTPTRTIALASPETATPRPGTSTPTPAFGTITGLLCYPSTETPPLTLYLKNIDTGQLTALNIARGQFTYDATLPLGHYIAYASTDGMGLLGAYTCNGSEEPCPFEISPGEEAIVNLCDWYNPPGFKPPLAGQSAAEVMVKLVQNMHARTGPHLSYPELGLLEPGATLPALRRSGDGEWLLVKHPDLDLSGWLHAPLLQIMGNPFNLPLEPESPPRETDDWQFIPAIWQSAYNQNIVHFKGEIRNESGQPVNGYSILLDNGTWSVLSHPTGASHHYPDVEDGKWDVVIPNETDAAGWWTMTVVRYNCPDFETGFNAQCKQFIPLSETKVVKVVHPEENVIEANWTCLKNCDQGLYVKPYRHPVDSISNHLLLYIEDRALKSSPPSPAFDHPVMKSLYDPLPDTPTGLTEFLAQNPPRLAPNRRYLLVNTPNDITWLADLSGGELQRISQPAVTAVWAPDSQQLAYLKNDTLYLLNLATNESQAIWQQPGLSQPTLTWADSISVATAEASWRISPQGEVKEIQPPSTPPVAQELARHALSTPTTWAVSHDGQKIAYNVSLGDPLTNAIIIFDRQTKTNTPVGPINGYRVPEIRWTADDALLILGATNPKFPSGGAIFTMLPQPDTLPEILLESDTAYLVNIWPKE